MSDQDLTRDLEVARLALKVTRQIDLDAVAGAIVKAILEYGRASAGFLYIYDGENDVFHLKASHLPADDPRAREIQTLDLAELRAAGPPSTWLPRVTESPDRLRHLGIERILATPLPGAGSLIGILLVGNEGGEVPAEQASRVALLLPELLPALVNAMVLERYRVLVIKDDQTVCFNRRYFDRYLSEEVYRARRYSTALSLIFLDLDNLKETTARFGHPVGSKAVHEVARRLVGVVRGSDRVFRYGGDEFCVVLPATGPGGARELAERLRLCLQSRPFRVEGTLGVNITASFGIASYPDHARTSLGLVKSADDAMQRAKLAGKNGIVVAGAEGGIRRVEMGG